MAYDDLVYPVETRVWFDTALVVCRDARCKCGHHVFRHALKMWGSSYHLVCEDFVDDSHYMFHACKCPTLTLAPDDAEKVRKAIVAEKVLKELVDL
jgi:hypothetical protein